MYIYIFVYSCIWSYVYIKRKFVLIVERVDLI